MDRTHLSFAAGWPVWTVALLGAVVVAWVLRCYWMDGSRPSWWWKGPLALLRLVSLAALLLMLSQPVLRFAHVDRVRPSVVLLVDNSESMARSDPKLPFAQAQREAAGTGMDTAAMRRLTRLERANALVNRSGLVAELTKRYSVRAYSFAGDTYPLPLPAERKRLDTYRLAVPPDTKTGDSTRIGSALRRMLTDLQVQNVAGALILSDGGSNLGEDPLAVAEEARKARIPVSAVGIGDPTHTRDIALLSVLADDVVRVNNTVTVYASLSQRGYAGKTVAVTLLRGQEVVGRQNVRLARDEAKQEIRFSYIATRPGRHYYTVRVTPQPDEVTAANNTRGFVQSVISKKLKVLYVESEPRYEYRYLKNAILRDTSLDFACLLLSGDARTRGGEGNFRIGGFPQTEKELFEFDILLLGDVPRSFFSQTQLEAIRRFVEDRGASLLVIAGEQHMPHEYAGTPLESVLPVTFASNPDPVITEDPFLWKLTEQGRQNPVTILEDDPAANRRVWESLSGMYWAAGVQRARPGATVLAEHPTRRNANGPYPLVALQPFGAGRCYISLVDTTWVWRWRVGDRYFYRYWGQVLRSLTPRELPGNSRLVQLNLDRGSYRLGERATLSARLLDPYYHPVKVDHVAATLRGEDGQTRQITLEATPGSPGLYTAQYQAEHVGKYEARVVSPANSQARATAGFVVESLALERQKPEMDEALLQKVAAAGGGKYYRPDALANWLKTLPNNPLQVRSEEEIELWNAPLLFLMFLAPLTAEWLVRKRKGML